MNTSQIKDIYPLTPSQEGLLFHSLSEPNSSIYVEEVICRVSTPELDSFREAFSLVVAHFDALRTSFRAEGIDQPVQIVHVSATVRPELVDLSRHEPHEHEQLIESFAAADRQRGFDLSCPPLLRVTLLKLSDEESVFVWTNHHLILDGWSSFRVIDEVFSAYDAVRSGKTWCAKGAASFKPFVKWLQARERSGETAFFREYLKGVSSPTKLPFEGETDHSGRDTQLTATRDLPSDLAIALKDCARLHRFTLNTLFQGVYAWLIARYSGESDVVFGTTVSGRPAELAGVESMVGLFINTLPARVRVQPNMIVRDYFKMLQQQNNERREFEHASLRSIQKCAMLSAGTPLFETLLAVETFPASQHLDMPDMRVVQATNYMLSLVVEPGKTLRLRALFDPRRVRSETAHELLERYEFGLRQLVIQSDRPLGEIEFSMPRERALLNTWNQTEQDYPASLPIHQRFEIFAKTSPQRRAVFGGEDSVTYGDLLRRADAIAGKLQQAGARKGSLIAMLFVPSVDMIVAAVGIARAGCGYAPLDATQPTARLSEMLSTLAPSHFLAHRGLESSLEVPKGTSCLDFAAALESGAVRRDPGPVEETDLLYAMHSSGSTGRPKAAGVYHHSFVNLMEWWIKEFGFTPKDKVLLINRITFDLTQKNFWGALMTGGEVHVVPDALFDPHRVVSWLSEHDITWMNCTPSMAYALMDHVDGSFEAVSSLRFLMLGGEPVQKERFSDWQRSVTCRTTLINTYGPTESTDLCSVHRFSQYEFEQIELPVSVGKALPNIQLFVLDPQFGILPPYCLGEVVIGGVSVGSGYLGNPSLTADKFIPDRWSARPGSRLYRTGDVGYLDQNGQVFVRGRVDSQIKLRGQRIELDEIDATVRQHELVQDSVTILGGPEGDQLVCYVVLERQAEPGENFRRAIRETLAVRIPESWLPAAYVPLETIKLNDNGKVDRGSLPAPASEDWLAGTEARVEPRTECETQLLSIWQAVLKRQDIGVFDNFFELGGDSLSITQVYSRLPKLLGVKVELADLFSQPTVAEQGALVLALQQAEAEDAADGIAPQARGDHPPLSSSQRRLLWLHQLNPQDPAYHVPMTVHFDGPVKVPAVKRALHRAIDRHEVLRTAFLNAPEGDYYQDVRDSFEADLTIVDLSNRSNSDRQEALTRATTQLIREPFDLSRPPLRGMFVTEAEGQGWLFLVLHHIITDGWSLLVIERELQEFYAAEMERREPRLEALPIQYADYALWQQSYLAQDAGQRQLQYWQGQLKGHVPTLTLSFDRRRGSQRDPRGGRLRHALDPQLSGRLQTLSESLGLTLYELLLSAFAVHLYRLSAQTDFNIGSPVANRHHVEIEALVGMFVNTLVLRMQLSADDPFRSFAERVRHTVREAQTHQDVPFEKLVEDLGTARSPALNPLFQVMFSLQPEYEDTSNIDDEQWVARFDLQVVYSATDQGLAGTWEYASALFDRETVSAFIDQFDVLLNEILERQDCRVADLPLCRPNREAQLALPRADETSYPRQRSIESLFAGQVSRAPESIALTCQGCHLTYAELYTMAKSVAAVLKLHGVQPGDCVGVGMARGQWLIASLLGVLMAEGCYVPLDPTYPSGRLRFMAHDARVRVVLSDSESMAAYQGMDVAVIDTISEAGGVDPDTVVVKEDGDERAAYVMYTSGTTGTPKGVLVPTRAVVRLVRNNNYCPLNQDTVLLHCANVAFDASTFEIWGALLNGGRLVISSDATVHMSEVARLIRDESVNTAFLTSGLFNLWMSSLSEETGLRYLLSGGEVLNVDAVRHLYEQDAVVRFIHVYGPTEATTFSSFFEVERHVEWTRPIPIGKTLSNGYLRVLDDARQPVPPFVVGELYVGGDGVAGYLRRPELEKERFLADPFCSSSTLYRTGDRVRLDASGNVLFVGRTDGQVKIRGFRIELEEVNSALQDVPGVEACVVTVFEATPSDRRLQAHVVMEVGSDCTADLLRRRLEAQLPKFMVPSRFVFVHALPLNASGKVDRKALSEATSSEPPRHSEPPQGELEELIWQIWKHLLGTATFGVTDDFFELGGHSLMASRVISELEQRTGTKVPLRDFFGEPTVRSVARIVELLDFHSKVSSASDQGDELGAL